MSILVAIAVLVIASGLSCLVVLGIARRSTAQETSRARATLEKLLAEATAEAKSASLHDVVLLEGKLVVVGQGCPRESAPLSHMVKRDEKVAACTRWLSRARLRLRGVEPLSSERAEKLELEMTDGARVALEGPVSVVLGSRLLWLGTAMTYPTAKLFDMTMALRDGDPVIALGIRRRVVNDDSAANAASDGYRESGGRQVLSSTPQLATLRLAATMRPHATMRLASVCRHPIAIVMTLLAIVPSIALSRHYASTETSCNELCPRVGACHVALRVTQQTTTLGAAFQHLLEGRVFICAANGDKDCRQAETCRDLGWCTAVSGQCKAVKDDDCARTESCRDSGFCSAIGGACRAKNDADCKRDKYCASLGFCSAASNGECRAGKDEDCSQASTCTSLRECSAVDGKCVSSTRDCAASEDCSETGRCTAVAGSCEAAKDEDCKRSVECISSGRCSAVDGRCRATRDDDCLSSADVRFGRIKASKGECTHERSSSCADSDSCRILGRCGGQGMCEARSDRDCAQSTWCKERGLCKLIDDECASSCATTLGCREHGLCSAATDPGGGKCRANTKEDCQGSWGCKRSGRCTPVNGKCVASDDDCKGHWRCRDRGECSAVLGECKIARDEDCKASKACRVSGRCAVGADGKCNVGKTEDCQQSIECHADGKCFARGGVCERPSETDCRSSPACRELGRCSPGSMGACVAKSSEDCRKSALCETYGWCELARFGYQKEDCFVSRTGP